MKITLTITGIFLLTISSAQQDIMYSQYMFNPLPMNPAAAATSEMPRLSVFHRKQWINFEGAPTTQALSLHSLILRKNVGLGLVVENDQIGVTGRVNVTGSYAYLMTLGYGHKIAAGISGGISNYNSRYSDPLAFRLRDSEDPVFASDKKVTVPNFGFGIHYRFAEKFYMGISIPRLVDYRNVKKFSEELKNAPKEQEHYYLTSGYSLNAGNNIKIKPSVLIKYVPAAPVQGDFNLNVMISDVFMLGAAYRTQDAAVAMIGLQVNNSLRIGYAYDITTSNLKNYSSNTHEVMAGYDFVKEVIKMKTPRFF